MKNYLIALLFVSLLLQSCGTMNKSIKKTSSQAESEEKPKTEAETVKPAESPIVEVKEKLVEVPDIPVDPHVYFVIIGSFKNLANAKKFQEQISSDGFASVLLQNDAGLYRVSVKSTDDITAARNEIRRIRTQFKKYVDTWLLISIK